LRTLRRFYKEKEEEEEKEEQEAAAVVAAAVEAVAEPAKAAVAARCRGFRLTWLPQRRACCRLSGLGRSALVAWPIRVLLKRQQRRGRLPPAEPLWSCGEQCAILRWTGRRRTTRFRPFRLPPPTKPPPPWPRLLRPAGQSLPPPSPRRTLAHSGGGGALSSALAAFGRGEGDVSDLISSEAVLAAGFSLCFGMSINLT